MYYLLIILRSFLYFPRLKYDSIKWCLIDKVAERVNLLDSKNEIKWTDIGISAAFLDERLVEYFEFFRLISKYDKSKLNLLDAGSILNHQSLSKHIQSIKKIDIFTLEPEKANYLEGNVYYSYGDLRKLHFPDNHFDLVISISTLEHIGLDNTLHYSNNQMHKEYNPESIKDAFIELHRVTAPKGALLITLPFGKSKNFDWLRIFDSDEVMSLISLRQWSKISLRYYLNDGWRWKQVTSKECLDSGYSSMLVSNTLDVRKPGAESVVVIELVK